MSDERQEMQPGECRNYPIEIERFSHSGSPPDFFRVRYDPQFDPKPYHFVIFDVKGEVYANGKAEGDAATLKEAEAAARSYL